MVFGTKRSCQNEKPKSESSPHSLHAEKAHTHQWRPAQPGKNKSLWVANNRSLLHSGLRKSTRELWHGEMPLMGRAGSVASQKGGRDPRVEILSQAAGPRGCFPPRSVVLHLHPSEHRSPVSLSGWCFLPSMYKACGYHTLTSHNAQKLHPRSVVWEELLGVQLGPGCPGAVTEVQRAWGRSLARSTASPTEGRVRKKEQWGAGGGPRGWLLLD